jgi:hypothetical protein
MNKDPNNNNLFKNIKQRIKELLSIPYNLAKMEGNSLRSSFAIYSFDIKKRELLKCGVLKMAHNI